MIVQNASLASRSQPPCVPFLHRLFISTFFLFLTVSKVVFPEGKRKSGGGNYLQFHCSKKRKSVGGICSVSALVHGHLLLSLTHPCIAPQRLELGPPVDQGWGKAEDDKVATHRSRQHQHLQQQLTCPGGHKSPQNSLFVSSRSMLHPTKCLTPSTASSPASTARIPGRNSSKGSLASRSCATPTCSSLLSHGSTLSWA